MASKVDQQSLILAVKNLATSLNRVPTRIEFVNDAKGNLHGLRKHFSDNFGKLLDAATLPKYGGGPREGLILEPEVEQKLLKQFHKLCAKTEKIQGFFRHTLDLEEMFRRAGNPEVLKMSGMPDTHVKFRDVEAVKSYFKFRQWYKPHVQLIFGDFPDCEGISHWPAESLEPRRLVPEMIEAKALLQEMKEGTPDTTSWIYLEGNHEFWIRQALNRMPELFEGLDQLGLEITLEKLLDLEKFGYELYPMNHLVQIGKAHFTHGIYCGGSHAKKHLDVFKTNIYYGHVHDRTVHRQTSIEGDLEAASQGCLARLDAKFLKGKPNSWSHGSGCWEFFRDGSYIHYWVPIINGVTAFCGNVFDGNKD